MEWSFLRLTSNCARSGLGGTTSASSAEMSTSRNDPWLYTKGTVMFKRRQNLNFHFIAYRDEIYRYVLDLDQIGFRMIKHQKTDRLFIG